MVKEIVAVLVVTALIVLVVMWLTRRARRVNHMRRHAARVAARANAPRDPFQREYASDPRTLKVGDLVEWGDGSSCAVRGTASFSDGADTWREHFIDPLLGAKRYLSVGVEDGELEVAVWVQAKGFQLTPGHHQVVYKGVVYTRQESGRARYTTVGTTDLSPQGRMQYHDYVASGGLRLSCERFGDGPWEVSLGHVIPVSQLVIYPSAA